MADRVLVRRMVAAWAHGAACADAQADLDSRPEDLTYRLWAGALDVEPMGVVARREVPIAGGLTAALVAIGCGHLIEFVDPARGILATEVISSAAGGEGGGAAPLATLPLAMASAGRTYEAAAGLRLRTAARIVDLSPGRARWLSGLAADPALRNRMVAVGSTVDPSELRLLLWAPAGGDGAGAGASSPAERPAGGARASGRVVLAAHVFTREGRMLLTETAVLR